MLDDLADFLKGTSTVLGAPGLGSFFAFLGATFLGLDGEDVAILTAVAAGFFLLLGFLVRAWAEDRVERLSAQQQEGRNNDAR